MKYRVKGETKWSRTDYELNEDFTIIQGVDPYKTYEFVTASVDDEYKIAESEIQNVVIDGTGT